jgi:hypothetical protein
MTSHSTLVFVAKQIARKSDTPGSDWPRSHLRMAPSDRSMWLASAFVLPYELTT